MRKKVLTWLPVVFAALLIASVVAPSAFAGNTDTPLHQELTYGLCSDTQAYQVKVAGVGMGGATTGTINLSLPATATVEKALLYWTGRDPFDGGDGVIRFQGNLISGIQTGGPAFWGTNDFAFAYKADVTSLVSPSTSSYTVEDPSTGDSDSFTLAYGAALVVVYKDSAVSTSTLVETWEGMDIALGDAAPAGSEGTSPVVFEFDPAALPRTATFSSIVAGIANGTSATLYYISGSGAAPSGDIFGLPGVNSEALPAAEDGSFMTTYDKSITIPAGHTWLAVQVRSGTAQLHWLAETLQMEAACPKVHVTKTLVTPASGLAHVGDTVTFQIQIENTGNTTLEVVPLADTYDTNYLAFSGTASPSPDDNTNDGTLNWADITTALGDLNPGDTKTVQVSFTAVAGTQSLAGDVTTNTATVSGAKDQNDNTAPDTSDDADVEISNPSIAIQKERAHPTPPDQYATVGETVRFTITVTNTGDTILSTVPLTDTYDTTYLAYNTNSATPAPDDQTDDGQLNWSNIGPLNPGESKTVVVEFTAIKSTWDGSQHVKVHNYAEVSGLDENGETVGPEEDTDFVRITQPKVSISKTVVGSDTTIPLNGQVTYSIVVTNDGDTVLDVVPLQDTFPTAYLDYSTANVAPTSVNEGAGTITWADLTGSGSLNPGESTSVQVTFTVTASSNPNTISNLACVANAEDEHGDVPNTVCDDTNIVTTNPQVTVTKTLVGSSPVLVGDAVQFQVVVENTGDTDIVTLPLSDVFDNAKLTYVSASPAPDTTGTGTLSWNDLTGSGSLAVGDSITITVNFTAAASTTPGTTVNTATVSGAVDENGDNAPNASDTADVQILAPASIGDKVWVDTNGNGIQDAGESGKDGVTVQLYTSSNTLVATQTTSGGGTYLFEHLFPGDYYIKVLPPSGYFITAQNQGTDDTKDSDADPNTGIMPTTTLSEGEQDVSWDAGLYEPATLGDFVWEDVNGDGLQGAGEPGIQGVTVKLHYAGPDGDFGTPGDNQVLSTQTDNSGFYSFSSLAPGTYYLEFVVPTGWKMTLQDQGSDDNADSDADRTTGLTAYISLESGESDNSWDAGMYRPVSIGDFTWIDSNANGVYDGGESALPNVTLTLYDSSNNVVASTTSDSAGLYTFDDLLPGTYTVVATTPAGYVATTSVSQTRTLQSGDTVTDADFGFISPTAVSIASFDAVVQQDGVHLTWRTMDETGVTQFRLQRATVEYGPWEDISVIAATGNPGGATYSVVDHNIRPGYTYYYRIVAAPTGTLLGPWSIYVPKTWDPGAGVQSGHRTFLPLLSR